MNRNPRDPGLECFSVVPLLLVFSVTSVPNDPCKPKLLLIFLHKIHREIWKFCQSSYAQGAENKIFGYRYNRVAMFYRRYTAARKIETVTIRFVRSFVIKIRPVKNNIPQEYFRTIVYFNTSRDSLRRIKTCIWKCCYLQARKIQIGIAI